jgi:hypothetical protein
LQTLDSTLLFGVEYLWQSCTTHIPINVTTSSLPLPCFPRIVFCPIQNCLYLLSFCQFRVLFEGRLRRTFDNNRIVVFGVNVTNYLCQEEVLLYLRRSLSVYWRLEGFERFRRFVRRSNILGLDCLDALI